ncbi:MAG: flagellar hook-basal body protein [Lachnospiraceae bacterium]|nr:flagellar hook-basal body protein [Lachnospiraceae bacterium]MBR5994292.1 flagellar hook-basal body protein [Lachnospiraceae bacterium]
MVRSLWTAATGMRAQQTNVDTIANNLANVNTTGYKTEVNEFKSLLYQTIQTKTTTSDNSPKPIGAQVGLGVRNSSITSIFTDGALLASESPTAFGLSGRGLFAVQGEDGKTYYTRNGDFKWAIDTENRVALTTSDGLRVLQANGEPIRLLTSSTDPNATVYMPSRVTVTADGTICYPDELNNPKPITGMQPIGIFQFNNPSGLEKQDSGLFAVTDNSGQPINEYTATGIERTKISQGYLEGSNVQVVDEMVNLITAQRAYELNSKAITASDEMLQQANNLR